MVTVAVNSLSVSHKSSGGSAPASMPDVCKTPSPGGPVPIPYPNVAFSSSLKNGTKKVKVDKKTASIKGCKFARSSGDEAGTAGGVVSGANMKEAEFILFSFDVKFEGKNVCRLTDKMTCNKKNTFCLGGELQAPVLAGITITDLKQLAKRCNRKVNRDAGHTPRNRPSGKQCTALGTKKHKCCEKAVKKYKEDNAPPKGNKDGDKIDSEVPFDKKGNRLNPDTESVARGLANKAYNAAKKAKLPTDGIWKTTYFQNGGAAFKADVLIKDDAGNITAAYDFKFNCKPKGKISRKQQKKYLAAVGQKAEMIFCPGDKF